MEKRATTRTTRVLKIPDWEIDFFCMGVGFGDETDRSLRAVSFGGGGVEVGFGCGLDALGASYLCNYQKMQAGNSVLLTLDLPGLGICLGLRELSEIPEMSKQNSLRPG